MAQRRICVITSGRADYGLLHWPMRAIAEAPDLALQLLVTGTHLDPRSGETVHQIEADGFAIDARVAAAFDQDTPQAKARAAATVLAGCADAFGRLQPDLVLLLGDRFEILACAQAAVLCDTPIAHLSGGDVTQGAFDDGLRHAVTKLSHVHLVTHARAARRVIQMGEEPSRVHVVGNPGLDALTRAPLMDRAALERALGAPLGRRNLLVTVHPVTLASDKGLSEARALFAALSDLPRDTTLWLTRPNADPGHEALNQAIDAWSQSRGNVQVRTSLGPAYLSLMAVADAVVGNSSSGLTEAPSVGTPTVDVGDRQKGRTAGDTVVHAPGDADAIRAALDRALALDAAGAANPYGDGRSSPRIVNILRALPPREQLLRKPFIDLTMAPA
jgi:UDP-hydrolysing UDP-N-acetyl-D-glucosamine 2-epimerase